MLHVKSPAKDKGHWCLCPVAAVTKQHSLDDLKQREFILSQTWRPEHEVKVSAGLCFLPRPPPLLASSSFRWLHHSGLHPIFTWLSPHLSVSPVSLPVSHKGTCQWM